VTAPGDGDELDLPVAAVPDEPISSKGPAKQVENLGAIMRDSSGWD
jgi:hypothetical protein